MLATRGAYYRPPEREEAWAGRPLIDREAEAERRRVLAVLLVVPRTVVTGHDSALLLHQLPRLRMPDRNAAVELTTLRPGHRVRRAGVKVSEGVKGVQVDGLTPAVSIGDAIAQVGCRHGQVAALIAADAAAHERRLDRTVLEAACARMAACRGAGQVRGLADLVEPKCESPGETRLLGIFRGAGIAVTVQPWIADERGDFARVDFLIEGTRVVVEFDGLTKYTDADEARREKQREHRLHRAGYTVVRVMWADLADVSRLLGRVRAAIAHAP